MVVVVGVGWGNGWVVVVASWGGWCRAWWGGWMVASGGVAVESGEVSREDGGGWRRWGPRLVGLALGLSMLVHAVALLAYGLQGARPELVVLGSDRALAGLGAVGVVAVMLPGARQPMQGVRFGVDEGVLRHVGPDQGWRVFELGPREERVTVAGWWEWAGRLRREALEVEVAGLQGVGWMRAALDAPPPAWRRSNLMADDEPQMTWRPHGDACPWVVSAASPTWIPGRYHVQTLELRWVDGEGRAVADLEVRAEPSPASALRIRQGRPRTEENGLLLLDVVPEASGEVVVTFTCGEAGAVERRLFVAPTWQTLSVYTEAGALRGGTVVRFWVSHQREEGLWYLTQSCEGVVLRVEALPIHPGRELAELSDWRWPVVGEPTLCALSASVSPLHLDQGTTSWVLVLPGEPASWHPLVELLASPAPALSDAPDADMTAFLPVLGHLLRQRSTQGVRWHVLLDRRAEREAERLVMRGRMLGRLGLSLAAQVGVSLLLAVFWMALRIRQRQRLLSAWADEEGQGRDEPWDVADGFVLRARAWEPWLPYLYLAGFALCLLAFVAGFAALLYAMQVLSQ